MVLRCSAKGRVDDDRTPCLFCRTWFLCKHTNWSNLDREVPMSHAVTISIRSVFLKDLFLVCKLICSLMQLAG